MEVHARRWDPPGLEPVPDDQRCPWHYGLCAYRADDPARCPWCHSTWATIRRTGGHSCERGSVWSGQTATAMTRLTRRARRTAERRRTPAPRTHEDAAYGALAVPDTSGRGPVPLSRAE